MAYVAIETKFLGATNYRPSRVKAWERDPWEFSARRPLSETLSWDHGLDAVDNHEAVARKLLPKVVHDVNVVTLVAGSTDTGYVFVPVRKG